MNGRKLVCGPPLGFKKLPQTKSFSSLNTLNADSPAHPQSVGRFTLFLSVRERKKTKLVPPVG